MKKIAFAMVIFVSILVMSSCEYDDSNDIDIIAPNDSTSTAVLG